MSGSLPGRRLAAFVLSLFAGAGSLPAQITVTQLGDAGWFADDSRDAAGDLVGLQSTHHGPPGLSPSAATGRQGEACLAAFDSSLLANRYVFATVPEPATGGLTAAPGALALVLGRRRLFQRHAA